MQFYAGVFVTATQDYITSLEQLAKPKVLDLFQKRYLRSLTVGNYSSTIDISSVSPRVCVENDSLFSTFSCYCCIKAYR